MLCSQPKLRLETSPPYILDVLIGLKFWFSKILLLYGNRFSELNDNEYLKWFIHSIKRKSKQVIKSIWGTNLEVVETNAAYFSRWFICSRRTRKKFLMESHIADKFCQGFLWFSTLCFKKLKHFVLQTVTRWTTSESRQKGQLHFGKVLSDLGK